MKNIILYLALIAAPSFLYCQNLNDFKTAASADGVNLIPFSDLRQEATSIADEVQRRKEDVKAFDYETFEKQKNNMLLEIKKKNKEIDDLKKFLDGLKANVPDVSTACFQGDMDTRKKAIDDNNSKIKDLNDKMKNAVDIFGRLYNARAGLREYFEKALSQLSDAKSNPNRILGDSPSDDDKRSLEDYINKIQDQIQSRVKEHKEQEDGARKRQADYQSLIDRTEPK
jgi:chromosome segregation ATPase